VQRCWLNANPVVLDDSDWLKIKVKIGATSWLVSFNIRGEIPSGPFDFLTSSWDSSFSTPGVVTWMSGMSGYNEVLIGMEPSFSIVKTEPK